MTAATAPTLVRGLCFFSFGHFYFKVGLSFFSDDAGAGSHCSHYASRGLRDLDCHTTLPTAYTPGMTSEPRLPDR